MTYGAIAAAVIGAGASVGGSLIAANNTPGGGSGVSDIQRLLGTEAQFRPAAYSAGLSGLEGQNAYGIGASPDQLALELVTRQIEQASNSNVARKFEKYYSNLQSLSLIRANGGQLDAKQWNLYNDSLDKVNRILGARGGAAALHVDSNGVPTLTLADPAQQQLVDAARQNFSAIQANRLTGQQNLSNLAANYPVATAENIQNWQDQYAKQINSEINQRYGQQSEDLLQLANTRGFNPAGTLGLLDQQKAQELAAVPTTAAQRALQLIGGQQGLASNSIAGINAALSPDSTIAIMNALRGQQTPTTGQLAAAQIAANTSLANNQNSNFNQSVGQASGNVSDIALLIGALTRQANKGPGTSNPYSGAASIDNASALHDGTG